MARSDTVSAREPLTRERIEGAALTLIEREGLAAFSTRKLAAELGCEAMSIYHHFPSKGHLMDALVDRVIGGLPPAPTDVPWIERIRRVAHDWRAMALAHPQFFQFLALHRLNTPTCLAWLDRMLAMFGEGGLDRESTARLFRATGYYLMGAGLDETAGYARGPSTVVPVAPDVLARDFPEVAAAGPFFQPQHHRRTFEAGLEILLAGIARAAEENRG